MQFADAFTMQSVEPDNLRSCNFVLGMIPTLQKFAADVSLYSFYRREKGINKLHICLFCEVSDMETSPMSESESLRTN